MSTRIFYSRVNLSWGFIARYLGASASQPSYLLPPPTTVVGAFGYPLLRLLSRKDYTEVEAHEKGRVLTKDMKALLNSTLASACGIPPTGEGLLVGVSTHQEISRIIALPYKDKSEINRFSKAHPKDVARAMPVQAVGASYGPKATLDLVWVVDVERLANELKVKPEDIDSVGPVAVKGVSRIGSKEGIVSVSPESRYVTESKVQELKPGDKFRTYIYVPANCVQLLDSAYAQEVILPDLKYNHTTFYVPALTVSGGLLFPLANFMPMFKLVGPCRAYTFKEGIVAVM